MTFHFQSFLKIVTISISIGVFLTACNTTEKNSLSPTISAATSIVPAAVFDTAPTEISIPTAIPAKNGWTPEFTSTVSATLTSQYTQQQIASLLFTQWLDHFKTEDADSRSRLDEYEIIKVEIPADLSFLAEENDVDFVATFVFSVKPYIYMHSNWNAGNGVSTDDVWIRNKFLITGVDEVGDLYSLVILGTGP